jgi:hypothetical protein
MAILKPALLKLLGILLLLGIAAVSIWKLSPPPPTPPQAQADSPPKTKQPDMRGLQLALKLFEIGQCAFSDKAWLQTLAKKENESLRNCYMSPQERCPQDKPAPLLVMSSLPNEPCGGLANLAEGQSLTPNGDSCPLGSECPYILQTTWSAHCPGKESTGCDNPKIIINASLRWNGQEILSHPFSRPAHNQNDLISLFEELPEGKPAGNCTGSWVTRKWNTVTADTGLNVINLDVKKGFVLLRAGLYNCHATSTVNGVGKHQAVLYDLTENKPISVGYSGTGSVAGVNHLSSVQAQFMLKKESAIALYQYCEKTVKGNELELGAPTGKFRERYSSLICNILPPDSP